MENKNLDEIIETHKTKTNKELGTILLTLKVDFENIKNTVIKLTDILKEVEVTYEVIYNELQRRLNFKDKDDSGL